MYCEKCGNKLEEHLKFCTRCGHAVAGNDGETEQLTDNTKNNKKEWIIFAICFLSVLVIAIYMKGKDGTSPNEVYSEKSLIEDTVKESDEVLIGKENYKHSVEEPIAYSNETNTPIISTDILNASFEDGFVEIDGITKLYLGETLEDACADGTVFISDGKTLDSIANDKNSFGEVYCALNNSFVVVLEKGDSGTLRDCMIESIYCGDYHLGEEYCSERYRIVFPYGLYYGMSYEDVITALGNPIETYSSEDYLQLRYKNLGVTIFIDYDTTIVEQIAWYKNK